MAKKFVKFLLFVTATCAVASGVYYFLKKKETDYYVHYRCSKHP